MEFHSGINNSGLSVAEEEEYLCMCVLESNYDRFLMFKAAFTSSALGPFK